MRECKHHNLYLRCKKKKIDPRLLVEYAHTAPITFHLLLFYGWSSRNALWCLFPTFPGRVNVIRALPLRFLPRLCKSTRHT
jgi:hypothetical protein